MLTTLVIFIVVLGVLVFVHELGHFVVAKRSGARVEEFGFGFPPRLAGVKRGGTLYSINWIPLGGFVRIKGEGGQAEHDPDSFVALPGWKRAGVLVAGVAMNLLLAMVLMGFAFTIGTPAALDERLPAGATVRDAQIQIVEVAPGSPAEAAGVQLGDAIRAIDGSPVQTIAGIQELNASAAGVEQTLTIRRNDSDITVNVTPVLDPDLGRATWGVGLLETGLVSYPWYTSLWLGVTNALSLFWQIVVAFVVLMKNLVVHQQVPQDLSGPIGIAALTGQFAQLGFVYLVNFTALLSLNLALINILPLPALDGGRLLFLAIEKIRRKRMQARTEALIHNVGFVVLMLLVVVISVRDVNRFSGEIRHFFSNIFG